MFFHFRDLIINCVTLRLIVWLHVQSSTDFYGILKFWFAIVDFDLDWLNDSIPFSNNYRAVSKISNMWRLKEGLGAYNESNTRSVVFSKALIQFCMMKTDKNFVW